MCSGRFSYQTKSVLIINILSLLKNVLIIDTISLTHLLDLDKNEDDLSILCNNIVFGHFLLLKLV